MNVSLLIIIIIERLLTQLKTMDVYICQVEILITRLIINLKRKNYNDNIYEYS